MNEKSELKGQANVAATQDITKKPYTVPRLSILGRVTDLTKGGGSVIDDVGGTQEGSVGP